MSGAQSTVRHPPPRPRRPPDCLILVKLLVRVRGLRGAAHGHLEGVGARRHHADAAHAGQRRGEAHGGQTVLAGPHAVQMSLGLEVNLVVEGDHDQHWQPERHTGRHDGVGRVHDEPALLGIGVLVEEILFCRVPAEEDGQEGDAGGRQPGQEDHHHRRPHRDRGVIHQGLGNRVISKRKYFLERLL